jgi:hypothetical protein
MHNKFEDIIGRIINIERACIEMGTEDFIPAILAKQGYTLLYLAFRLMKRIAWDGQGDMVQNILLRFLKKETCRADLDHERVRCLY